MSELQFCRQYLTALDARPIKLSSDHIADARQYPAQSAYTLPRLQHPPHPQRPNAKPSATTSTPSSTKASSTSNPTITLKPLKPSWPTLALPTPTDPKNTSIYDLKTAYSTHASLPTTKIKILYKKKPVLDSKTVAEIIGEDADADVEFGVMIMGGAVATPVQSPPAAAPAEAEKGLAGAAAQGPSGKEVVATEEFWEDLRGFVVQRTRDEQEGNRLVGVFREAWSANR